MEYTELIFEEVCDSAPTTQRDRDFERVLKDALGEEFEQKVDEIMEAHMAISREWFCRGFKSAFQLFAEQTIDVGIK